MTFAADFLGDFLGESLEIFSHFLFNIRLLCLASLQNCSLSLEIMRIPNSHKDSNGLRVEINLFFFLLTFSFIRKNINTPATSSLKEKLVRLSLTQAVRIKDSTLLCPFINRQNYIFL